MIRPAGTNPHARAILRALTPATLVLALCGGVAAPYALATRRAAMASVVTGDGQGDSNRVILHTGNGKFNRNYASVLSPTVNRGLQQISSTNVSGRTVNQVALCHRKHRFCKISQHLGDPFP